MGSIASGQRRMNKDNVNPHVKKAQYAVRGELAVKAEEYRVRLQKEAADPSLKATQEKNGVSPLPFDEVIFANIGNPQQLKQKPFTFFRQVLSILENPSLLENEKALKDSFGYKEDVFERAKRLIKDVQTVGAYSLSNGATSIRESIAKFIERRDGYSADPAQIYMCAGASSGVSTMLNVICSGSSTGILVPIPQYPLYTATLSLIDSQCVPYYLDEKNSWATDIEAIKSSLGEAKAKGIDVRAIVVINPGNPTGASLTSESINSIIDLAVEEKLVIIADEVYQTNIFKGEFISFKKGLRQLQEAHTGKYDHVELASLHSVSKGMVGECGHRGGYFEIVGFDSEVVAEIYKYICIMLCPSVIGQCLVELMVNPPVAGDPSYELYQKEYSGIADGLHQRALALYEAFKQMEGVECQEPQGAMYLFPYITLPEKAVAAAKAANRKPDEFYTLRLLDATGVCLVPGSGFGQKEGTLHFRTTFLAPGTAWVERISAFHKKFMDEFR